MQSVLVIIEDKPAERERAMVAIKKAAGYEGNGDGVHPIMPILLGNALCTEKSDDDGMIVLWAADLESALQRLDIANEQSRRHPVGVITDLMFPATPDRPEEEPNGLGVIAECIKAKLPVVVCSDTHRHDVRWLRPIFPIIEKSHPLGRIPIVLDNKDWDQALSLLADLMEPVEA